MRTALQKRIYRVFAVNSWLPLCTCLAVLLNSSPSAHAQLHTQQHRLYFDESAQAIVLEGFNLPSIDALKLYFGSIKNIDALSVRTTMIANCQRDNRSVLCRAKYGFEPGATYTVEVPVQDEQSHKSVFEIIVPRNDLTTASELTGIYPSSNVLPMNQLKIYLEFSQPMQRGQVYKHVKLYKLPENSVQSDAFLQMPEELWDRSRTRLTLWLDPGRIKRGLAPNTQLGLPLVSGQHYRLDVDAAWQGANGETLKHTASKHFYVDDPDRSRPNETAWVIDYPRSATREPLTIHFNEAMDYALLQNALMLDHAVLGVTQGEIALLDGERVWQFTPQLAWPSGAYSLVVNAWLEDIAGNSLRRKFDVNLHSAEDEPRDINSIELNFSL